jgi:hypothetical protein
MLRRRIRLHLSNGLNVQRLLPLAVGLPTWQPALHPLDAAGEAFTVAMLRQHAQRLFELLETLLPWPTLAARAVRAQKIAAARFRRVGEARFSRVQCQPMRLRQLRHGAQCGFRFCLRATQADKVIRLAHPLPTVRGQQMSARVELAIGQQRRAPCALGPARCRFIRHQFIQLTQHVLLQERADAPCPLGGSNTCAFAGRAILVPANLVEPASQSTD